MAYQTPGRRRGETGSPSIKQIPEGPIQDFSRVIMDLTTQDDWQRRVQAFEDLVHEIPDGSLYLDSSAWFNTPKTLWHLAPPVNELLKDARSTVIRRVCTALTSLFAKCQSDARLLFKDMMPTILQVHAQTVQVIRTAVQAMVTESIPEVPCKSVMPYWMDRLKDKSPAIRDACSLYLGLALQHWTEEGYLTDEIWMQVGNCLLKTMRDPSPQVRTNAKLSLERMRSQHPHRWQALISDEHGPACRDPKLLRWLTSLERNEEVEELSIASKYTFNSARHGFQPAQTQQQQQQALRISSPRILKLSASHEEKEMSPEHVPFSIAVTHKATRNITASTAVASAAPFQYLVQTPLRGTPPRPPVGLVAARTSSPTLQTYSALAMGAEQANVSNSEFEYSESSHHSTAHPDIMQRAEAVLARGNFHQVEQKEGPFIASMYELKQHAQKRRSRNSILMQERFRASGSNLESGSSVDKEEKGDEYAVARAVVAAPTTPLSNANTPKSISSPSAKIAADSSPGGPAPEHMILAIRLLRAHKLHVDQIMETLKMEMDTLRDFDRLLEEPGRPTEDELINYYEAVDLCLEQRFQAGCDLRNEMDRISAGEPPEK